MLLKSQILMIFFPVFVASWVAELSIVPNFWLAMYVWYILKAIRTVRSRCFRGISYWHDEPPQDSWDSQTSPSTSRGLRISGVGGGIAVGETPESRTEPERRPHRRLIAKFLSLDGKRGVFFFASVTSFTDNLSSQTMIVRFTCILHWQNWIVV